MALYRDFGCFVIALRIKKRANPSPRVAVRCSNIDWLKLLKYSAPNVKSARKMLIILRGDNLRFIGNCEILVLIILPQKLCIKQFSYFFFR